MPRESGLPIEKPISIWQRPVEVDYRELFKRLGQAAANDYWEHVSLATSRNAYSKRFNGQVIG
ncbi:MAG: hypothetical protein RLZZ511_3334 [Cyanobacteriota bacterium]|jgi:hypothetical protein